ncbi:7815_t:CDS:2, partial [Paraglomus brasilianum]
MSSELESQSAQSKIDFLFEELEKKNKIDTSNLISENAELRDRVTKLEQKQTQTDSIHVLEDSILHEATFDISSNIYTYSSEPKSSENKEIDEFLDFKKLSSQYHSISKNIKPGQIEISEMACPKKFEGIDGSVKCIVNSFDINGVSQHLAHLCDTAIGAEDQALRLIRKKSCAGLFMVGILNFKYLAKIGLDKIKHIKNYSANSISELTNDQIQEIINHGSESQISNSLLEITPEVSSEDNIIEIFRMAHLEKALLETEINVPSASRPKKDLPKAELDHDDEEDVE